MPFATKSYDAGAFLKYRSDFTQAGFEYHGYAEPGTSTTNNKWKVYRITLNTDGTTDKIDFMNASSAFDQIWDNHLITNGASTSYS